MLQFDHEIVGKIGSMALVRSEDHDLDYNVFSRLGADLTPDFIWVSSGAVEIGRLDYRKHNDGRELTGYEPEEAKADYASQGQSILMENYRRFIDPNYSVRQLLVEHMHFNDPEKRDHIRRFLMRARAQKAIPIVNYNDTVSIEEIRKMELMNLRQNTHKVVECVDNDETAAQIAVLVRARILLLLTSAPGILRDTDDHASLIPEVSGRNEDEVLEHLQYVEQYCSGSSRSGANGMKAKLQFLREPILQGTTVIIGSSQRRVSHLLDGRAERTIIRVR